MNITLKATHFELTPAIKAYTEEKIGSLAHYDERLQLAKVELEKLTEHKLKEHFRAEATVDAAHHVFRAEALGEDLYAAIDLLVPKLVAQVEKQKNRNFSRMRSAKRKLKEGIE